MSWRNRAACRSCPWWFAPQPPGRDMTAYWARRRTICNRCPVQDDCLTVAVDGDEPEGMWGGLTPEERQPLVSGTTGQLALGDAGLALCRRCGFPHHGTGQWCSTVCENADYDDRTAAMPHGAAKYRRRRGCRCEFCTAADTARKRAYRARVKRGNMTSSDDERRVS